MGIPVIAKQRGFYGTKIREENDKFNVESEDELGTWMHRLDGGEDKVPTVPDLPQPADLATLALENAALRKQVSDLTAAMPRPTRKSASASQPSAPAGADVQPPAGAGRASDQEVI